MIKNILTHVFDFVNIGILIVLLMIMWFITKSVSFEVYFTLGYLIGSVLTYFIDF